MYYIDYVYGISEQIYYNDDYVNGKRDWSHSVKFQSETIKDLINQLITYFDISNNEQITIDDIDHNVLSITKIETIDGYQASQNELEQWMRGKIILYKIQYTIYVYIKTDTILNKTIKEYLNDWHSIIFTL